MPHRSNSAPPVDLSMPAAARCSDTAHVMRLMRLLITAVDHAGEDGLVLKKDAALVGVARSFVNASDSDVQSTRTAVMALRDLVWRMDTARSLIEPMVETDRRGEIAILLATDDIHQFLSQEP